MEERVILVDAEDRELGPAFKLPAHRTGQLHRAVSVFVFDDRGRLLLQQRAATKYHSPSLWSNTCCGHPRPGEATSEAAHRRLREEMGFDCALCEAFSFVYRAELAGGLVEHEYDHVFVGQYDGRPRPDPEEVAAWRWTSLDTVIRDAREHPDSYTTWFRILLSGYRSRLAAGIDSPTT